MPTLIFSRVGACPPFSPRAGAHASTTSPNCLPARNITRADTHQFSVYTRGIDERNRCSSSGTISSRVINSFICCYVKLTGGAYSGDPRRDLQDDDWCGNCYVEKQRGNLSASIKSSTELSRDDCTTRPTWQICTEMTLPCSIVFKHEPSRAKNFVLSPLIKYRIQSHCLSMRWKCCLLVTKTAIAGQ